MKTYRAVLLIFFLFLSVVASAQPRGSAETVSIHSKLSVERVVAGEEFQLALILDIKDEWHINAHQPLQDYLIGTEFSLSFQDHFILTHIEYPGPKEYEFAFAPGEILLVYEGREYIFMSFRAASTVQPGEHELTGSLSVQACDDNTCLAPARIEVRMPVEVIPAGSEAVQINDDIFSAFESRLEPDRETTLRPGSPHEIGAMFDAGRALWAFAAIFLIGLALNLTPCVYPMLSVTVSVFGSQTDTRTGAVFAKAVTYLLGIATTYSLLGVAAAFTGRLFGFWLQSPLVLTMIGILMLLLALSMFGLYSLQMPYWLSSRLGAGKFSGYAGIYFSGLVVGVFAAPCIGPPIIALITFVGTHGDPLLGFWIFFVLSLGLGFPYLILGTFTGLLQKLPKSGNWMNWVKKVFGVVLIGLGLFYIGLAFFAPYVMHILVITMLAGGVYLGFIERTGADKIIFRAVKAFVGLAIIAAGLLVLLNLQKEGIEWEEYSPQRLEYARENNIPVIIDFYADWCIPCLELELNTFTDPRVIEAVNPMIRLKVDMTHFDSPESEELRRKFEIAAVPTIIFLDENGREVLGARVTGFINPDDFLKKIETVMKNPSF